MVAENPKVHSKGMQHGKPRTPGSISHPGEQVPLPGPRVGISHEEKHSNPYEVAPGATHHKPGGGRG